MAASSRSGPMATPSWPRRRPTRAWRRWSVPVASCRPDAVPPPPPRQGRHHGPVSPVAAFVRSDPRPAAAADLRCRDLLALVAEQAAAADRTRDVAPEVVAAIKASDLLALSAGKELGGLDG